MAVLPGLQVGLTLNSATFIAETRRVDASVNRLAQNISQQNATIAKSFGGISTAAGVVKNALLGLVGAIGVQQIVALGKNAIDTAGNLGELAQQAGVGTKALQVLTFAAVQNGVSQQQLVTSLAQFGKRTAEAAAGNNALAKSFRANNIEVRDSVGNLRKSEDVLGDLSDAVKTAGSGQDKVRIAMLALGRAGAALVPILAQGRDGLADIGRQAEAAGVILSDRMIVAADRASDAFTAIQHSVATGFQIGVIEAFGSALNQSLGTLTRAREIGEEFGTQVGAALRGLVQAAGFVADHFNQIKAALAGLIAFKAAQFFLLLAGSIGNAARAMLTLNVALLANPFAVVATAVAAVVGALVLYQDEIGSASGATSAIGNTLRSVFDAAREAVSGFVTGFDEVEKSTPVAAIKAFGDAVGVSAEALKSARGAGEAFGRFMADVFNGAVAAVEFLASHLEEVKAVLIGVAVAKTASFFFDLGIAISNAASAAKVLGVALLANPWTIIGVGIAAAVAALVLYRNELVKVNDQTVRVGDITSAAFTAIKEAVSGTLTIIGGLGGALASLSKADFAGAFESAQSALDGLLQRVNAPIVAFQQLQGDIAKTTAAVAESQATFNDFAASTGFVRDRISEISGELAGLRGRLAAAQALDASFGGPEQGTGAGTAALQQRIAALEAEKQRIDEITASAKAAALAVGEMDAAVPDFATILAAQVGLFKDVETAVDDTAAAMARMSDAGIELSANLEVENAQLTRLRDAYDGIGESVETVIRQTKIENQLRAVGASESDAKLTGLYQQIEANVTLAEVTTKQASAASKAVSESENHSKSVANLSENLQAETEQMQRLLDAYDGGAEAVKDVTAAIAVENKLRSAGIKATDAQAKGLTDLSQAYQEVENAAKAAAEVASLEGEGAQLQAQIDARGQESEQLRVQLAILEARQELGDAYTDQVGQQIAENERLVTVLSQQKAANDLQERIQQQGLLLQFGGRETEEYRVQIQLLKLKSQLGTEIPAAMEEQVRLAEAQTTAIQASAEAQGLFADALKNAAAEIQREFVDTFEAIYSGGVTSFSDLASEVKRIFIRLAAEMTALLIFKPEVALQGLGLLGGAAGSAGAFGGLATVGTPGAGAFTAQQAAAALAGFAPAGAAAAAGATTAAPVIAAAAAAPATATIAAAAAAPRFATGGPPLPVQVVQPSLFGSFTGALNSFGTKFGFASGLPQVTPPPQAHGMLTGGGVTSAGGGPAPEALVAPGATLSQTLGAGAIGMIGGSIVGGLFGGQGGKGGAIGGGLGAAAGFGLASAFTGGLGGPAGAAIGGGIGALLGGLTGGLFGGGNDEAMGDLRFRSVPSASPFDRGPFGGVEIGGENAFEAPLRALVAKLDETAASLLTGSQKKLAAAAVQALDEFDKRAEEADPSKEFAQILSRRAQAIFGAAFADLDFEAAFAGAGSAEEIVQRAQDVAETIQTYGELVEGTSPAVIAAGKVLTDITDKFDQVEAGAKALGLSIEELAVAEQAAIETLRGDVQQQVNDLLRGVSSGGAALELRTAIEDLHEQFAVTEASAIALGISVKGLDKAEREAVKGLEDAARARIDTAIAGGGDNPAAQLSAALQQVNDDFAELFSLARELDLPTEDIKALNAARSQERKEIKATFKAQEDAAKAQIANAIDTAFGTTNVSGPAQQYRASIEQINTQFAELKVIAIALGDALPVGEMRALTQASQDAKRELRSQARASIQGFVDQAGQGAGGGLADQFRSDIQSINVDVSSFIGLAKEAFKYPKEAIKDIRAAGREMSREVRRGAEAQVASYIRSSTAGTSGAAAQVQQEIDAINANAKQMRQLATALGQGSEGRQAVNAAAAAQRQAVRREGRESIRALIESVGQGGGSTAAAQLSQAIAALTTQFREARELAAALGMQQSVLNDLSRAEASAKNQLRQQAYGQLQDILASANADNSAGGQFRAEMTRINKTFTEAAALARALGISEDVVNAARTTAINNLKAQAREQIQDAIASADRTSGPGQEFKDELDRIQETFADAAALAIELGMSLDTLRAAEQRAVASTVAVANARLDELIATGNLTGAGAHYAEELARIRSEFADARKLARELGRSVDELNAAQGRAISGLKDEVRAKAEALRAGEQGEALLEFKTQLDTLNESFAEVIIGAAALEISVGDLAAAQTKAVERLKKAALENLDLRALEVSREFDAILNPLREFSQELKFSVASPTESFRLAREEFERIAALARSGDISAIAAIPQAGRLFLEQATQFGASPGRVAAETEIQDVLEDVIQATTTAQKTATAGMEDAIKRASDREVDKLSEMVSHGQETIAELRRVRNAIEAVNITLPTVPQPIGTPAAGTAQYVSAIPTDAEAAAQRAASSNVLQLPPLPPLDPIFEPLKNTASSINDVASEQLDTERQIAKALTITAEQAANLSKVFAAAKAPTETLSRAPGTKTSEVVQVQKKATAATENLTKAVVALERETVNSANLQKSQRASSASKPVEEAAQRQKAPEPDYIAGAAAAIRKSLEQAIQRSEDVFLEAKPGSIKISALDKQISMLLDLIDQGTEARAERKAAGLSSDLLTEQIVLAREMIAELKRLRSVIDQKRTA